MQMAVAKKDQERAGYAWMYGAQASKDGKERAVPQYWEQWGGAWLQGYDGTPLGEPLPPVSNSLEAELDDSAVNNE